MYSLCLCVCGYGACGGVVVVYVCAYAFKVNGTVVTNLPANAGDVPYAEFSPWFGKIPWRRKWQPTPVFLPGQRSLAGYSARWGHKESDMTEHTCMSYMKYNFKLITLQAKTQKVNLLSWEFQLYRENSLSWNFLRIYLCKSTVSEQWYRGGFWHWPVGLVQDLTLA